MDAFGDVENWICALPQYKILKTLDEKTKKREGERVKGTKSNHKIPYHSKQGIIHNRNNPNSVHTHCSCAYFKVRDEIYKIPMK